MIDLKLLQKDFDGISAKLWRKNVEQELLNALKLKNEELKKAKSGFETLQALQNSMSKEFPIYKKEGKDISELKAKLDKNKKYLLYCHSGNRSGQALKIFRQLGFAEAYDLDGGISNWSKALEK